MSCSFMDLVRGGERPQGGVYSVVLIMFLDKEKSNFKTNWAKVVKRNC